RIQQSESFEFECTIDFDKIRKEKYYKTTKQGKSIAEVSVRPLGIDEQGKTTGFILQYKDITARREVEMQLEESNKFHQTILNKILDIVVVFSKDDNVSYINDAGKRVFGESGELLGEFPKRTEFVGEHFEKMQKLYLKAKDSLAPEGFESIRLESPTGDIAFQSGWYIPLVRNGLYDGMVITSTDVTARQIAREKEQQHLQFMETVIESLVHPFYVIDANTYKIRMANSAAKVGEFDEQSTCYALTHMRDTPCEGANHPCPIEIVKETKKSISVEHTHTYKNGESQHIELHAYPIFDAKGDVTEIIEYGLDITENKKNIKEIKINESRYRSLFENSSLALWEEDYSEVKKFFNELEAEGVSNFREYFENNPDAVESCVSKVKVLDANKTSVVLHGVQKKEELLGNLSKHFGKDGLDVFREELIALAEGRTFYQSDTVELSVRGKKQVLLFQLNVPPGFEDSLAKVYLSITDMTELSSTQEALRTSEERNRKIVNNITEGVNLVDLENYTFKFVNPYLCKILGYTKDELIGMRVHDIHPKEEIDIIMENIDALSRGENVEEGRNVPMIRKDGKIIHVNIKTSLITIDGINHLLGFFSLTSRSSEVGELDTSIDQNHEILELKEQVRNEKLLRYVAERSFHTTNFEQFVYQFLSDVGSHFDADRVGIFMIDPKTKEGSFKYEWCAKGTPKIMNRFQNVTGSKFLKEMLKISTREPIVITDIDHMSTAGKKEKDVFHELDIKSLLTVPFRTYNKIQGLIGLSSSEKREFSIHDQFVLQELAMTLSQKMEYHDMLDE
ncbi:MAG: PAS domain S-box protein, partial [Candidatus Thorarchaeota archaeon]